MKYFRVGNFDYIVTKCEICRVNVKYSMSGSYYSLLSFYFSSANKAINNFYMCLSELRGLSLSGHLEISKTTVDVGDLLGELRNLFGHVFFR